MFKAAEWPQRGITPQARYSQPSHIYFLQPFPVSNIIYRCFSLSEEAQLGVATARCPDTKSVICVDYKCTLTRALQGHAYSLPVVSHVLATLTGVKIFGKLDLTQAY